MNEQNDAQPTLPCAVQVGFAGSRRLWGEEPATPEQIADWDTQAQHCLAQHLVKLSTDLGLKWNHFLVGISQIACGGDTLFTCACQSLRISQRIFLPQHRADYLGAEGSNRAPDFSDAERDDAEKLLESDHIIEERVVSHSADRTERFEETNAEILRASDVVLCLRRDEAVGARGGTQNLLERAKHRGIPALDIRVRLENGRPIFESSWEPLDALELFTPLQLPEALKGTRLPSGKTLPSVDEYCDALKRLGSAGAAKHQWRFRRAAVIIIATHIAATILATLALEFHHWKGHTFERLVIPLLLLELVSLGGGLLMHRYLHQAHAARTWATLRVVAELVRSIRAIAPRHTRLEQLFRVQLPLQFRGLMRTLNVLYLRSTRSHRGDPWEPQRDAYLRGRVDDQISFYTKSLERDQPRFVRYQEAFMFCSMAAVVATVSKLILLQLLPTHSEESICERFLLGGLGTLAILLPVLAVAGLSWSAALDYAARVETFKEALDFLKRERRIIEGATSAPEFDRLLAETETVLLGEIAGWYVRRANTGVA